MTSFTPQQARSQQTLDAILKACDTLLAERTFETISMQDIANEAGISVGNMYNRFKDKNALIDYIITTHQLRTTAQVREELNRVRTKSLETSVLKLTRVLQGAISQLRPLFVTLAVRTSDPAQALAVDVQTNTDTLVEEVTTWLMAREPQLDAERVRFAVASIAFNLQFNLLFGTPARLFGNHYISSLSQQASAYMRMENQP